jgi:hypothetical protein
MRIIFTRFQVSDYLRRFDLTQLDGGSLLPASFPAADFDCIHVSRHEYALASKKYVYCIGSTDGTKILDP